MQRCAWRGLLLLLLLSSLLLMALLGAVGERRRRHDPGLLHRRTAQTRQFGRLRNAPKEDMAQPAVCGGVCSPPPSGLVQVVIGEREILVGTGGEMARECPVVGCPGG